MYRLTVPLNQIIGKLEEDIIAESRQVLENIELLNKSQIFMIQSNFRNF